MNTGFLRSLFENQTQPQKRKKTLQLKGVGGGKGGKKELKPKFYFNRTNKLDQISFFDKVKT